MSYTINTTATVYTIKELKEVNPKGYRTALDWLVGKADETWYLQNFADTVQQVKRLEKQPELAFDEYDPYRQSVVVKGMIRVPNDILKRWESEDPDNDLGWVPVGEFYGWLGWRYFIGGEMYGWVSDSDGQELRNLVEDLRFKFLQVANDSYEASVSEEHLVTSSCEAKELFHWEGKYAGTTEDLKGNRTGS